MDRSDALKALGMEDFNDEAQMRGGPHPAESGPANGSGPTETKMEDGQGVAAADGEEVDEEDLREQQIIEENYQIWKKNTPFLYDLVIVRCFCLFLLIVVFHAFFFFDVC